MRSLCHPAGKYNQFKKEVLCHCSFFQDIMTFEQRPTTANAILCNTFLMDISLTFLHCKAITVMGLCP